MARYAGFMFRPGRWWWHALVALVVGGLLSMHGVTWLSGQPAPAATSMVGTSPASHGHGEEPAGGEPHSAAGHLAALCLAVLAGAGLHLVVRRRLRPVSGRRAAHVVSALPASAAVRPAHPPGPGRLVLSVARC